MGRHATRGRRAGGASTGSRWHCRSDRASPALLGKARRLPSLPSLNGLTALQAARPARAYSIDALPSLDGLTALQELFLGVCTVT